MHTCVPIFHVVTDMLQEVYVFVFLQNTCPSCVPKRRRTFHVLHEEVLCSPRSKIVTFHAQLFVCIKEDILCIPRKTFHASTQNISCVPKMAFVAFHSPNIHMPLFVDFSRSSQDLCKSLSDSHKSWEDRLNSPKSGMWIFKTWNGLKIARITPISMSFGRNRSRRPKLFFPKLLRGRKKFSRRPKKFATHERSNERGARKCQVNAVVES